ncbi:MAG: glycosyltransferase family protein [Nitrospiraceae bacterium]|nr:glycosyltransferase family protein [Nitrospiraceae bacterium]
MDERKIFFFTCVSPGGEEVYSHCERHIRELIVPEGFRVEIGQARGAPGLAEGYNLGMARSGARYKVYLHQDAFIINRMFLFDVLRLFMAHPEIGLMGVAGCGILPASGIWWQGKNLTGKVIEYRKAFSVQSFADAAAPVSYVQAIDGLIMITQYDLPWREDLFTGFHFYDISQSLEFIKAGRRVAIPAQTDPWCIHYSAKPFDIDGDYLRYKSVFLEHYGEFCGVRSFRNTLKEFDYKLRKVKRRGFSKMSGRL